MKDRMTGLYDAVTGRSQGKAVHTGGADISDVRAKFVRRTSSEYISS